MRQQRQKRDAGAASPSLIRPTAKAKIEKEERPQAADEHRSPASSVDDATHQRSKVFIPERIDEELRELQEASSRI